MAKRKSRETQSELATVEAAADDRATAPVDPEAARAKIAAAKPEDAGAPKPRRGRPKGSGGKMTKAELQARVDELEAALPDADKAAELEAIAQAIAGTVQTGTELWIARDPDRLEPWRFDDKELGRIGSLWAPCLQPYMASIGAASPWIMAVVGTGQIVMTKRAKIGKVEAEPQSTGVDAPPAQESAT